MKQMKHMTNEVDEEEFVKSEMKGREDEVYVQAGLEIN